MPGIPQTALCGISPSFPELSPTGRQVVYVLLDRAPLSRPKSGPFDLHTLGTPLAFVLSQDQTLHEISSLSPAETDERTRAPPPLAGEL
jgi:hypothetical protein